MNRQGPGPGPGPGPAPVRNIPGFPAQQNVQQQRHPALNAGRPPNGKLGGGGSGWGFGMPMTAAPGLQTMQTRNASAGGMGSFAQSIGGSQPATPLDLSEFPSLSGAPQTQNQNPSQAVWAQRQNQPSQPGRQPQQPQQTPQATQQTQQQGQSQSQPSHDDMFSGSSQFGGSLDDFRITNQLPAGTQPQTGNIDEFPPLGREGSSNIGQERRSSLMQNTGFGAYANGMAFAGMNRQQQQSQQRNPLTSPMNGSQDQGRIMSPSVPGLGAISSSRSPNPQSQNGSASQDKLGAIGSASDSSAMPTGLENQRGSREQFGSSQSQQIASSSTQASFATGEMVESPSGSQQPELQPISQMSEIDKWGIPGLLAMLRNPSQDIASLTIGQNLTTLGLDVSQTEELYKSFATPFAPSTPSRPLENDFTLPQCYKVANVQPLQDRIPSFSEETLFYIFYSMPRDIMQEIVAEELMARKWRYHKVEKMWVTRDETYQSPVEIEHGVSESGFYLWWDWEGWKRVRRQYVLRYADLDDRSTNRSFAQPSGIAMGRPGQAGRGA